MHFSVYCCVCFFFSFLSSRFSSRSLKFLEWEICFFFRVCTISILRHARAHGRTHTNHSLRWTNTQRSTVMARRIHAMHRKNKRRHSELNIVHFRFIMMFIELSNGQSERVREQKKKRGCPSLSLYTHIFHACYIVVALSLPMHTEKSARTSWTTRGETIVKNT